MKTRTDKELKDFTKLINAHSFNYAVGKRYDDALLMDKSLKKFAALSQLLNSEGYYIERVGTKHLDGFNVTYNIYEVRESEL